MRVVNPEFVLLFLVMPILMAIIYFGFTSKSKKLSQFIDKSMWDKIIPSLSISRKFWKKGMFVIAIMLIIFCMIRPQYGKKYDFIHRRGLDIVIALDTSISMLAEDIKPNRIERAKQEITSLVDQFTGDRIGLISFAGAALIHCPLTIDYSAIKLFANDMQVGMVSQPGSQLFPIIQKAEKMFNPKEKGYKVLLIYTDGEFFDEDILKAAKLATSTGIKIFTTGIGSKKGEPLPIKDEKGKVLQYKRDKENEIVLSRLNEENLIQLALKTNGNYFISNTNQLATTKIYKAISLQEKKEIEQEIGKNYKDQYHFFLLIAFVLLASEFMIFAGKKAKEKWLGRT